MMMDSEYHVATGVTVVAGVFLALGALFALINTADIIWRRGWKTMMWIMIPVYIINATYMGPISLYLYFMYGRAKKSKKPGESGNVNGASHMDHMQHGEHSSSAPAASAPEDHQHFGEHDGHAGHEMKKEMGENHDHEGHDAHAGHEMKKEMGENHHDHEGHSKHEMHHDDAQAAADPEKADISHGGHHHHMHDMEDGVKRPFWALVLIGVAHCGSGCVLGDLVGEWLVYGTGATINGRDVWPCLLIDYGFALLFGIFFQYFTIAPMSGEYGVKTLVRAAKADILSLTAFELGLFGWMVAYQVGIWDYRLEMNTWAYWWQMQIGMFFGFWTSVPVNWWLIKNGIKEPCV